MSDLTLRCPTCGQRADMCFEHGDDWKKRPDDPTVAQLLVKATMAELMERVATFCDEDVPPRPRCFMADHSVPYGQVYRQWNTRGELIVWVNRGEIEDLPRKAAKRSDGFAIAPNAIDTELLLSVPVVISRAENGHPRKLAGGGEVDAVD